jgi:hypothetical protein
VQWNLLHSLLYARGLDGARTETVSELNQSEASFLSSILKLHASMQICSNSSRKSNVRKSTMILRKVKKKSRFFLAILNILTSFYFYNMTFTNIAQQCNSDWIGKQVKRYLYQFLSSKSNFQTILIRKPSSGYEKLLLSLFFQKHALIFRYYIRVKISLSLSDILSYIASDISFKA